MGQSRSQPCRNPALKLSPAPTASTTWTERAGTCQERVAVCAEAPPDPRLTMPPAKDQPLRDPNDVYVSRVGADEYAAGAMAAQRMVDKGAKSIICVQEEVGDGTQTARCQGMSDVATKANIKYDHVAGDPDSGKTDNLVEAYLRAHSDVDGIVATGQPATAGLVAPKKGGGRTPMQTAGFDVSPDIISMIQKGDLDFTMDQQGWWRGYISVMELTHYIRYGLIQSNYFLTGPQIVDKANADAVAGIAAQGVR